MKLKNLILAATALGFVSASTSCVAQDAAEVGGDAAATQLALFNPDEFAWRLFFSMNRPALAGKAGVADPGSQFGRSPELPVVWETWALESGSRRNDQPPHSEVYKPDGSKPVSWDALDRRQRTLILDENLEQSAVLSTSTRPSVRFDRQMPVDQEVRANRPMYEFIIKSGMYNLDGLSALYKRARSDNDRTVIQFPQESKEIKAQWYPIPEAQKARYLWRAVVGQDGKEQAYGLVSLHIITKDLPNWFWADFGHVDCESNQGACDDAWLTRVLGPHQAQEPALTPLHDSTTVASDGIRPETKGTLWENYRLRGTQTSFVSPIGSQIVLSNPVIENGFQQSSCMTCHARATVGPGSQSSGMQSDPLSPGDPELGAPNQTLFGAGPGLSRPTQNTVEFLQTDFVWSAPFRAHKCTATGGCL